MGSPGIGKLREKDTLVPFNPIAHLISHLLHLVTAAYTFQKVFVTIVVRIFSKSGHVKTLMTLTKEGFLAAKKSIQGSPRCAEGDIQWHYSNIRWH